MPLPAIMPFKEYSVKAMGATRAVYPTFSAMDFACRNSSK